MWIRDSCTDVRFDNREVVAAEQERVISCDMVLSTPKQCVCERVPMCRVIPSIQNRSLSVTAAFRFSTRNMKCPPTMSSAVLFRTGR